MRYNSRGFQAQARRISYRAPIRFPGGPTALRAVNAQRHAVVFP